MKIAFSVRIQTPNYTHNRYMLDKVFFIILLQMQDTFCKYLCNFKVIKYLIWRTQVFLNIYETFYYLINVYLKLINLVKKENLTIAMQLLSLKRQLIAIK